jgi:hypothetical protein
MSIYCYKLFLENRYSVPDFYKASPNRLELSLLHIGPEIRKFEPIQMLELSKTTIAKAPPEDLSLGEFGRFPREVRDMIWGNFSPQWGSDPDEDRLLGRDLERDPLNNQAILRASHKLYDEVLPYLYKKETLCFRIYGHWEQPIIVSNSRGARWLLGSIMGDIWQFFCSLPYKRLKGIKIEISAPDLPDPGQLICLCNKVYNLVDVLSQSERLPEIEIHLVENHSLSGGRSKWVWNGEPRKSILQNLTEEGEVAYEADYDAILMQFCRLRDVPKVTIFVPEDFDREEEGLMIQNIERIMQYEEPFGTFVDDNGVWSDDLIQNLLDKIYIEFEDALDTLRGTTAGMLRLNRFASWYDPNGNSTYLEEMGRISTNVTINLSNLALRHIFMLAFHPLSAFLQRVRKQRNLPRRFRYPAFMLADRRYRNEWFRYFYQVDTVDMVDVAEFPARVSSWSQIIPEGLTTAQRFKGQWMDYYHLGGLLPLLRSWRDSFPFTHIPKSSDLEWLEELLNEDD